jgi:hypothetical protein
MPVPIKFYGTCFENPSNPTPVKDVRVWFRCDPCDEYLGECYSDKDGKYAVDDNGWSQSHAGHNVFGYAEKTGYDVTVIQWEPWGGEITNWDPLMIPD